MGLFDRRRRPDATGTPPAKTVVAAAVPLAGPDARRMQRMRPSGGQEAWQKDAWYFYDAIGELWAPLERIALALSKAEPYAAVVDPETGEPAGRSENPQAQAAARAFLGGAKARAQLLYLYAVAWQVGGEVYIIIRPQGGTKPDQWLVLTGNKLTSRAGSWSYPDPYTGETVQLREGTDQLIRVWSPHPNDPFKPNSGLRAALPVLSEIEMASQNIAARLSSRVASNGLLLLPEEADYPQGYGDAKGAAAWSAYLLDVMGTALANPGEASAQVPITAVLPAEVIQNIVHLDLATLFDAAVQALRESDLSRLAASLPMPKAVAEGTEAEANHWSAWQVDETTYSVWISPLLERLSDSGTEYWFRPALIAMGVEEEEAERTILAWDTAGIVVRPDQSEDMKWAWEKLLISDSVMLDVLGRSDEDMPDQDEYTRRALYQLVSVAPTLLSDPAVAEALDLGIEVAPAAAGVQTDVPGASNPPELEPSEPAPTARERGTPETQDDVPAGLTAAAELLVFDALSRAGGRLLTRENRGQFTSVPKHELHTVIPAQGRTEALLQDSFQFADVVATTYGMEPATLREALHGYVTGRLVAQRAHDREHMKKFLR